MSELPDFVVFIDFDGVTHPLRERTPRGLDDLLMGVEWFCPENVSQINRLLRNLNAVGVISSAWRLDFPWEAFQGYFEHRLVGRNPLLDGVQRLAECRLFLEQQGWTKVPWVAIDDKPLLFGPEAPLIATDYRTGLTARNVDGFLYEMERERPLCEFYCTVCHRPFVAATRPVKRTRCPACGSTDFPAIRKINTDGFMYYQMSEGGQEEMKRAQSGWCHDNGIEVVVYDKSPLCADAVRIGTLDNGKLELPAIVSTGGSEGGVQFELRKEE